jgi:quercetin dioxygenase-like cupin family protein
MSRIKEIEQNLTRIKELTETVVPYHDLFKPCDGNKVELMVDKGYGFVTGLMKIPEIAIINCHYDSDTEFPHHQHDEVEYFIIYKGVFHVEYQQENYVLNVGDIFRLNGNVIHRAWTEKEGCDLITITIPANKEFPNGK